MKLTLTPKARTARSTISCLYVNDRFECYVLEPPNPIPAGGYAILLLHSARFNRTMPFLQNVPGHSAIEIHWGNTAVDTRDCLLVGRTVGPDEVGQSREAFDALFAKLEATSPITIEITREAIPPSGAPAVQPEGVPRMADPVPTAPAPGKITLTNHAPVTASLVAGAATSVLIALGKAKYGLDLSGQEGNLTLLIGALVGYLTKGAIA